MKCFRETKDWVKGVNEQETNKPKYEVGQILLQFFLITLYLVSMQKSEMKRNLAGKGAAPNKKKCYKSIQKRP